MLRLSAPRQFSGDADCGRQQQAEIALWDAPARLAPHVGRRVQVSGRLDCPRGGYVLRELRIGAAPAPASAPVAATPAAPGLALQQLLRCRTADGADSLLHLYEDGLYLASDIGAPDGRPRVVLQTAGRHVRQGERWQLQRLATRLPWPGAGWDSVAAQQITELVRACRVGELTPRVRAEAAAMRRPAPPGF